MRGFQNGYIFEIWPSGSGGIYLNFSTPKNWVFLDRTYRELMHLKNDPKCENKSLFDANFYGA